MLKKINKKFIKMKLVRYFCIFVVSENKKC